MKVVYISTVWHGSFFVTWRMNIVWCDHMWSYNYQDVCVWHALVSRWPSHSVWHWLWVHDRQWLWDSFRCRQLRRKHISAASESRMSHRISSCDLTVCNVRWGKSCFWLFLTTNLVRRFWDSSVTIRVQISCFVAHAIVIANYAVCGWECECMYSSIASQHSSSLIGLHHHCCSCVGSRAGLEQRFIVLCDHIRLKTRLIAVIYATLHCCVRLSECHLWLPPANK